MTTDHPVELTRASRDRDSVEWAVAEINRIYATKTLETYLALGRFVLEVFYEGSFESFHSKERGGQTVRALAGREDLMVSPSLLWKAVAVMEQHARLPGDVRDSLSATHHTALLAVKDEGTKVELARTAVGEGLSTRDLANEVRRTMGEDRSRPGRPAVPGVVRALGQLRKGAVALDREVAEGFGDLEREEQVAALEELAGVMMELRRVRGTMGELARGRGRR